MTSRARVTTGLAAVVLSVTAQTARPFHSQDQVVYRVPVTGAIELGIAPYIERTLREAATEGAQAVVLEINTLGGRVDAALNIVDAISESEVPVYAFVHPRAISAGALIAVATDSIFIVADGHMGASTVVGGEGQKMSEKAQSVMRAQYRALAERRGLDPRIGEAMVDEEIAVEGVVEAGKLLTLTADEAVRVGYAVEVLNWDDVLANLGLDDARVVHPGINWAERLVRFLSHPIVAPLLLSIGTLGLIIEIKTPSFGLAGITGILALSAFFGSHLIVGLAGWEEVILLGAGLIALGIEVFVMPGFGIAGVIALLCIGSATFLALIGALPTWADVARAGGILAVAFMIVVGVTYALVRHLPTSDRLRGIFLRVATTKETGFLSAPARNELIGAEGVAVTDLRPSGTIRAGEERLDVVADSGFIPKGTRVRIIRSEGYRLVVEAVGDAASV